MDEEGGVNEEGVGDGGDGEVLEGRGRPRAGVALRQPLVVPLPETTE